MLLSTADPLLRAFARHDAVMLLVDRRTGRIAAVSTAAVAFYGLPEATLTGMTVHDLDAGSVDRPPGVAGASSPDEERAAPLRRHRLADGSVRTVEVATCPLEDGDDELLLAIVRDVTDAELARASLAASEERFRLLAENAYDVIWTMALDGTVTYVSPSVQRMRGITPEEAMAQTLEEIHPPESRARTLEYYGRLFAAIAAGGPLPEFHGDQEYYRKDGSIMIGELHVVPQVDAAGRVVQILGVTRDVTEQRRYEAELHRQARIDTLTGLLNRAEGLDRLAAALVRPRDDGSRVAVAFVDLDGFKAINDAHGHASGDAVLQATAQRITGCVGAGDLVIRVGGDEILVVLDGIADLAAAESVAEDIRRAVASPVDHGGAELSCTASIGVTLADPDEGVDAIVARADDAMYRAKGAGRDRVEAAAVG